MWVDRIELTTQTWKALILPLNYTHKILLTYYILYMNFYKLHLINKKQKINITIVAPENKSILEIAEDNNINLPYSCRNGCCSTCLGKLIKGSVIHIDQTFLDETLLNQKYILTCTSYLTSDSTILTHEENNLYDLE